MMGLPAHFQGGKADLGLRLGAIGLGVVLALVFAAPLLLPFDAETMSADAILAAPDATHWLGTDHLGRDVFARTVLGGRSTLALAVAATALGVGIGATIGMVAGYRAGLMDDLLMRTSDAVMALPSLILAMLVMVAVGSGPAAILLAIVLIFAPRAARITRSVVLNVARLDFVAAASVIGESQTSVLVREILPNVWPNILVEACLRFSYSILLISALGYLGIGIQPPTPDWGLMISEGAAYITAAPWMIFGPALGIVLAVISVNIVGDGLQERIGARLRRTISHV
jgi:peptide/nickel transport system permease protein